MAKKKTNPLREAAAKDQARKAGKAYLKTPSEMHRIEIKDTEPVKLKLLPYKAGENNPSFSEGSTAFYYRFYVHKNVGPNNQVFVCPNATFGKRCPMCEAKRRLLNEGYEWDDKKVKNLKTSERFLANVWDLNNPKQGVQIFEYSTHLFLIELLEQIESADPEDDSIDKVADMSVGGTYIKIRPKEKKFSGSTFYDCTKFSCLPHSKAIPKNVLSGVVTLEGLLNVPTYKDIYEAFTQEEMDNEISSEETDEVEEEEVEEASELEEEWDTEEGEPEEEEEASEDEEWEEEEEPEEEETEEEEAEEDWEEEEEPEEESEGEDDEWEEEETEESEEEDDEWNADDEWEEVEEEPAPKPKKKAPAKKKAATPAKRAPVKKSTKKRQPRK